MKQRIRILLVDDLEKKRQAIARTLTTKLRNFDLAFEYADRYETARDQLASVNFDFVILDIKIPAGSEEASEKWSRQLLRDIVDGSLCFPMHVFGITEHRDIADAERQYYEANMFGFFVFDWEHDNWANSVAHKIEYLASAMQNGAAYRLNSFDYDFVVLAARETEFEPIKSALFGKGKGSGHPLWPDRAYFGVLSLGSPTQRLRGALICIGQTGLAPAAAMTTQAIQVLRPRVVAMLGMCAGFESKGVKVMDALIARESACWQEGKSVEGKGGEEFDSRSRIRNWSGNLGSQVERQLEMQEAEFSRLVEEFSRKKEYLNLRAKFGEKVADQPTIRHGLIVSGSAVIASEETAQEVIRRHPSALGLEMEIFAVYTAAELALGKRSEFVAIKGVADLADKTKRDESQRLASELSAELFKRFLAKRFESPAKRNH